VRFSIALFIFGKKGWIDLSNKALPMAGEFLKSHGIDIDAEMARIQDEVPPSSTQEPSISDFSNVSLPHTPANSRWDVSISSGKISSIQEHKPQSLNTSMVDGNGSVLAPSLCHPHIHIDKAYLLSHPKYSHLQIEKGDFQEAMSLTGSAKQDFEEWDLLERGQRVIDEGVAAGVTHMRAFVEVDAVVGIKCLDAGIRLKKRAEDRCMVQICAFAQLPLFTSSQGDEGEEVIRELMREAAGRVEVDVVGSTPYVEGGRREMEKNVQWMIELAIEEQVHLDFHLDYNLDAEQEPMVWYVVKMLKEKGWKKKASGKTVVLGHCTRLTLFKDEEWRMLREEIGDLPISFVGLPTSDLFMMRTPDRTRGTLDIPRLIKEYNLNACIGINNIGNAFTPHGSCDPLTLACNGVGIYQAGKKQDAELLYECISTRARRAIGLAEDCMGEDREDRLLELKDGGIANVILFGCDKEDWRSRRSIAEVVYLYDHCRGRLRLPISF
jgi:cytosine/adenosine deaminase-related metal-dependent hydrolase